MRSRAAAWMSTLEVAAASGKGGGQKKFGLDETSREVTRTTSGTIAQLFRWGPELFGAVNTLERAGVSRAKIARMVEKVVQYKKRPGRRKDKERRRARGFIVAYVSEYRALYPGRTVADAVRELVSWMRDHGERKDLKTLDGFKRECRWNEKFHSKALGELSTESRKK